MPRSPAEVAAQRAVTEAAEAAARHSEAVADEIADERARVAALAGQLVDLREAHAVARGSQRARDAARAQLARAVRHRLDRPATEALDGSYDEIHRALVEARRELQVALDALDAPSSVAPYRSTLRLDDPRYAEQGEDLRRLRAAAGDLGAALERHAREEEQHRSRRARRLMHEVRALHDVEVALLGRLSRSKREMVLGFGAIGLAQLEGEAQQLALSARWYVRSRPADLAHAGDWLARAMAVSSRRGVFIELLILLTLLGLVLGRWRGWLERLRAMVIEAADSRRTERQRTAWVAWFEAVGPSVLWLLGAYGGFALLGELVREPEVDVTGAVVRVYAWYRLLLSGVHHLFVASAVKGRGSVAAELSQRILRSVRLVMRYAFLVVALVVLSKHLVGPGYLHGLVIQFCWIGLVPIAYLLVRHWRAEVGQAYLARFPGGLFLRVAASPGSGPWSVFRMTGPTLMVTIHSLWAFLRDSALRFDRTRRALAFFFRRRVERAAETVGRGTADVSSLPASIRHVFALDDCPEGVLVDHFPSMDRAVAAIRRFKDGGPGYAAVLVGERGVGKTTWLRELDRRTPDLDSTYAGLQQTLTDEAAVCLCLSEVLAVRSCDTVDALVEQIDTLSRRIVLLDHCQNLVLRSIGGMRGLQAFAQVLRRTTHRLVWVCSFARHAFEHARYVLKGEDVIQRVHRLGGWSEEHIAELIDRRMEQAGQGVGYQDLLPGKRPGSADDIDRVRQQFQRLIWDYSEGVPRVALHFWLRSLVDDEGPRVRVRPFEAPGPDDLEGLQEQARFVLQSVVGHESMTLAEATESLQQPDHECLSVLEMLRAQGYLELSEERYRVSAHWDRAVMRYLRRKHLIYP